MKLNSFVPVQTFKSVVSPYTAQRAKFSINDFFSKSDQVTEKILNEKLHFVCSVTWLFYMTEF